MNSKCAGIPYGTADAAHVRGLSITIKNLAPTNQQLQCLLPDIYVHPMCVRAEYRLVAKKGEGTFSEVLKAQCIKNGKYVAIKCMKNHFDSLDQVSLAAGEV